MRIGLVPLLCLSAIAVATPAGEKAPTAAEVLESSAPSDWRELDPANTLQLELATGRVVIELAPQFAPRHVANVRSLVKAGYFDGLVVLRAQDNYVVQWGDPQAGEEGRARSLGQAQARLAPEFYRPAKGLPFTRLDSRDAYAEEVGFSAGFPAARDDAEGRAWLCHCYGMAGAGRDIAADSGSGSELYVVIGHAPRHLDRNVTLLGRVVQGMEQLSTLRRGPGPMGFYERKEEQLTISSVRLAEDLPPAQRASLELLRTDTETFRRFVEARRQRREEWFVDPVGRIDLCNVPLPVREKRLAATAPEGPKAGS
jgi:peptidylprolyl isomerase